MYYQQKVQTFFSKPSEKVYLEILKVPIVTTEDWNNHIHIHIDMFKKLLIELFEHQLPTKTKKKTQTYQMNKTIVIFFSHLFLLFCHTVRNVF